MRRLVLTVLGREWSGLILAAIFALLGFALAAHVVWLGNAIFLIALACTVGSIWHLIICARTRRALPPPGRLVDLCGYGVHVRAEGKANGLYPVVWFGGGHSAGLAMEHVHRALSQETRSILIDRPGTGWSDTGPFPRTTAREAEEMIEVLEKSGEVGPFVFAGYSFGGLLVANIARRRPDLVARLVLLDATPLETIVFGPRLNAIKTMRRHALATALLRLVGIHFDVASWAAARNPAYREAGSHFERELGPALDKMREIDVHAGHKLAEYDIYRELVGSHVGTCGWETVVYDGDLGDMHVWLVAPGDAEEVKADADIAAAGSEQVRMLNFFARSRERYMAISSRARRVSSPAGSTHQFVYAHPDFVIATIRHAVEPIEQ